MLFPVLNIFSKVTASTKNSDSFIIDLGKNGLSINQSLSERVASAITLGFEGAFLQQLKVNAPEFTFPTTAQLSNSSLLTNFIISYNYLITNSLLGFTRKTLKNLGSNGEKL